MLRGLVTLLYLIAVVAAIVTLQIALFETGTLYSLAGFFALGGLELYLLSESLPRGDSSVDK